MPAPNATCAEPATAALTGQAVLRELAETCLRGSPYSALKHVSCDYRGGVLVLRGSVPSYYLKQIAQEAVARLGGAVRVENQIQVETPAC